MPRNTVVQLIPALAIGCMSLGGTSAARAQEEPQPPPPFEQVYQMPTVYQVPGMDKVQVRRDVVYKTVETPKGKVALKLDSYVPADAKKGRTFPGVILISGGGIEGGDHDWRDAGVYKSYGRLLAASGFVGVTFNKRYGRGPVGTLNGIEDLGDLVGYVRQHDVDLSVDKNRLAFWAFSAGGLLLAPVLKEGTSFGRAVVCFYCASDIDQDSWAGAEGITEESRARARAAGSSVEQIQTAGHPLPPIFVGRAGWDSPGLNRGIDKLVLAALAKNAMIEVMNHPTGRHGFDIIDSDERSREIIRHALEFLETSFKVVLSTSKHDIDVVAPDGVKLKGTYYAGQNRGPVVILFHQCSRSRDIWAPLATRLADEGLRVLTVEPRGIGESQGEQWDYDGNLDHALQYWRKNWSADAEAVYQWLLSQPGVDKSDVALVGGGCGAFLALLTAQRHYPAVRTIVLLSDFDDDATKTFLRESTGLAILSAVSEQDPMSLAAAKEIHALSKNPGSRLLLFAEPGHGFGLIEKNPELESTVIDWLKIRLVARR